MHSHQLKLDRADLHIDTLDKSIKRWFDCGAYTLVDKPDPKTGHHVLYAQIEEAVDPSWALIVGDAVHNLRSALDHLAFGMLSAAHGGTLSARMERKSEFPMVGTISERTGRARINPDGDFDSIVIDKLPGLSTQAIEAIRELQPYKRGAQFENCELWLVHDLDRVDKHRRLSIVTTAANLTQYAAGGTGYFPYFWFGGGIVKDGDKVAEWADPVDPTAYQKVNIARQIAFGEGEPASGRELVATLRALREFFGSDVLPALSPYL